MQSPREGHLAIGGLIIFALWLFVALPVYSGLSHKPDVKCPTTELENLEFWQKAQCDPVAYFTLWLVVFTGVLASSTIGLWVVTWRSGVRQSRDMQAAISAARDANSISRENILSDQRAWIAVGDLQIETNPIHFRNGGAPLMISVRIANIGKTPALEVHTKMEMIFDSGLARDFIKTLSKEQKSVNVVDWTRTLLPGDSFRRHWGFTVAAPDARKGIYFPVIVGCTTYKILDSTIHQTGFVFHLFECVAGNPTQYVDLIKPERTPLPNSQIGWDGGSGGFAN